MLFVGDYAILFIQEIGEILAIMFSSFAVTHKHSISPDLLRDLKNSNILDSTSVLSDVSDYYYVV